MRRVWSRLLSWILTDELAQAIEGDLEEGYRRRASRGGAAAERRARLWVAWQVVTLPYLTLARRARRLNHDVGDREEGMRTMLHDLKLAVRSLARRPTFALLVIGTLGLGIGAFAALFSVVDEVLLRPVDLPGADDLVVARMQVDGELRNLTGPNATDLLRESGGVFASGAAFWTTALTLTNPDGTRERRPAVGATPGVFETVGVPLQLGRPWGAEEVGTGSISTVVISDPLWRSYFGADSTVVGRTLDLNGTPARIAGVLSVDFTFPTVTDIDFVFPPPTDPAGVARAGLGGFSVLARLRPGVSLERARAEVAGIWEGLRARYPGDLLQHGLALLPLQSYVVREVRPALLALLGATSLLLLLACANAANVMLARGLQRRSEMSIRASLGAGRGRLARQLFVEGAVFAGVAGLAGILLASGLLAAVRAFAPSGIPGITEVELSPGPTLVALAAAMACALLAGLVPALCASGTDLSGALRSGARTTSARGMGRLQAALVVTQVSVTVVLSIGAGLLARSFSSLSAVDPGYRTEGVLTASLGTLSDFETDPASWATFYRRVEREVSELPEVEGVGTTLRPPFSTGEISAPLRLADADAMTLETAPRAEVGIVSGGYVEALDIPLLRGRTFTDGDVRGGPRVALLSASLARSLYGEEDPIGRRLAPVLGDWESATNWAEVVGVVGDILLEGLDASPDGTIYLATSQIAQPYGTLVARTEGDPTRLADAVRETVLRVEPRLLAPTVQTLASLRAESLARPRFNLLLLGAFSALALTLSVVGIYGMLSYSVATRRVELGVRVAFGADRRSVVGLVLRDGMKLVGLGLAIGLMGAVVASRAVESLLYGIPPTDPVSWGATLLTITAVALVGCLLPALRASAGDVVGALQSE